MKLKKLINKLLKLPQASKYWLYTFDYVRNGELIMKTDCFKGDFVDLFSNLINEFGSVVIVFAKEITWSEYDRLKALGVGRKNARKYLRERSI